MLERSEVIADMAFARRDRDLRAVAHGQNAVAHRAIAGSAIEAPPGDDRDAKRGQEIGVARQDAETAAGILGANRPDVRVDEDRGRIGDPQLHAPSPTRERASSISPTM